MFQFHKFVKLLNKQVESSRLIFDKEEFKKQKNAVMESDLKQTSLQKHRNLKLYIQKYWEQCIKVNNFK